MTEDEAKGWLTGKFGGLAVERVAPFVSLILGAAEQQNLLARSTLPHIWSRHVVDSAQLLTLSSETGPWLDIGSGAGLPGIVIALLSDREVVLCEPRRLRAEFLLHCVDALQLAPRVRVSQSKVERLTERVATISARAVAPLPELFGLAAHCSTPSTVWLLPKGRSAAEEVAIARRTWQGVFHVEQSVTDPQSSIVIASGVARR